MSRKHWKVLQIIPHLEESLVFSRLLREALTELKTRIPRVKGKERFLDGGFCFLKVAVFYSCLVNRHEEVRSLGPTLKGLDPNKHIHAGF